jgi:hypothetical protein
MQAEPRGDAPAGISAAAAIVARIADDRMPGRGELDPDLMLAPRVEAELEEAIGPALGLDPPIGDGALRRPIAGPGLAHEAPLVLDEPRVQYALGSPHRAFDQRDVEALGDELVPARHEQALRPGVPREDDDARGVPVDAMDHGGAALGVAAPDLLGGDVEEALRARAVGRDDGEPRRLVVGQDGLVLVDEERPDAAAPAARPARGASGPRAPHGRLERSGRLR